jgi:hypothetical protein
MLISSEWDAKTITHRYLPVKGAISNVIPLTGTRARRVFFLSGAALLFGGVDEGRPDDICTAMRMQCGVMTDHAKLLTNLRHPVDLHGVKVKCLHSFKTKADP